MRPTCTPSPCTSCLVFPYKTSKQIRLLLLFASRGLGRPTSLLGGISTILRTASRFFIRSLCAFCRSHTGSDEKIAHPGRAAARRRFRLSKKSGTVKISQQIRTVLRNRKIGFCVPYFRSSLPILSLRGGRLRPTRQS